MKGDHISCLTHPKTGNLICRQPAIMIDAGHPNRGKVNVSLREEDGNFHLEIRDNGYILTGSAANLITHLHDFFIEDNAFRQLCLDNSIGYSTSKDKDGETNVTYIMFPTPTEEIANRNEEPLFF